jgi:hypothetical protein
VKEYRVVWEIDIEAESPEEAAVKALDIQRDASSTAVVFDVELDGAFTRIDLGGEL